MKKRDKKPKGPTVYGYARASTQEQEETLLAQEAQIKAEYEYRYKPAGLAWGGMYVDRGVSGGVALRSRPEGMRLSMALDRDDTVIFAKLDRGFRSLEDLAQTLRVWKRRGVRMALLDIRLDTGSPVGEMVVCILGAVAQFEKRRIGERTKEALQSRKARGVAYTKKVLYPFKRDGRRLVPDFQWKVNGELVASMFNSGYTVVEVQSHLNSNHVPTRKGGEWSATDVRTILNLECWFQDGRDPERRRLWDRLTGKTESQVENE